MRANGRAADDLRPVAIERNYVKTSDGSALVSFGDTRVICTANLDPRVPPWLRDKGQGWVTAEYGMLPGSASERIGREHVNKGRAQEISRLIGRSLRAVVDLPALGECQVKVDCDVLQADGGTRTAAITGAFVALFDALDAARQKGNLPHVPIHAPCAAVSAGVVNETPLLDLDYAEDLAASVDLNVVMDATGRFIEVQGSAEGEPFDRDRLDAMLRLAERGIDQLIAVQREVLGLV